MSQVEGYKIHSLHVLGKRIFPIDYIITAWITFIIFKTHLKITIQTFKILDMRVPYVYIYILCVRTHVKEGVILVAFLNAYLKKVSTSVSRNHC
jgi:hypothetical protein